MLRDDDERKYLHLTKLASVFAVAAVYHNSHIVVGGSVATTVGVRDRNGDKNHAAAAAAAAARGVGILAAQSP